MTPTAEEKALREPFAPDAIGKLPRITCAACRNNKKERHCEAHTPRGCKECGNYMTPRHIHLDYVGHAHVTERLLQVDPSWSWEPMGTTTTGAPALDDRGGLWIRLTVLGVARPGYGHADGRTDPDAVKIAIGDAIRNAAMRFGVALDHWKKEPAAEIVEAERPARDRRASKADAKESDDNLRARIVAQGKKREWDLQETARQFTAWSGERRLQLHKAEKSDLVGYLNHLLTKKDG